MGKQLHKRVGEDVVKFVFKKYLLKQLPIEKALDILKIKRTRFFELLKGFKDKTEGWTIEYRRSSRKRIDERAEEIIIKELEEDKKLIEDKTIPVRNYNYSYVRTEIERKYKLKVSLPTIISRAKENNYYIVQREKKKHDREVLTNYPGELIQHDSSYHKFSPYADVKWYLITSLDDYSRYMLYGELKEHETSWAHIMALENVFLKYGVPFSYYVDCHSIFRFVQGRDSIWREHRKITDEVGPQFKQVLSDCDVKITYALSPQAKGKIERPYQWIQDRLVRTCAKENIKTIEQAREVLKYEIERYNTIQVHSTTREIPAIRFAKAIENKQSLFRDWTIKPPFVSTKDIFCLREEKYVDGYHKISINNLPLKVQNSPTREKIQLRIYPDINTGIVEIRFWFKGKLIDVQKVKKSDLYGVHF